MPASHSDCTSGAIVASIIAEVDPTVTSTARCCPSRVSTLCSFVAFFIAILYAFFAAACTGRKSRRRSRAKCSGAARVVRDRAGGWGCSWSYARTT
jgi:hypothetical protein